MAAGTLTLTNNSDAVAGVGTAFSTELAAGDFIVANVGGIAYTLPVKAVASDTSLTMVSKFSGPTMSGLAWFFITRDQQAMVTAALVTQNTEALRVLNMDKANWQAVFSAAGDITVTLPDGTQFTGPSWQKIVTLLEQSDLEAIQPLADQVRADALQVAADKTAAETAKTAAQAAKTSAESAASTASTAKTDAVSAKDAAVSAAGTATSKAAASEASAVRAEAAAESLDTTKFVRKDQPEAGRSALEVYSKGEVDELIEGADPGTIPVNKGGTGATTAAAALANLGAFSKAEINDRLGYALISTTTNLALGSRMVLTNPFGNNVPVVVVPEMYHATLQKWITTDWVFVGQSDSRGVRAHYSEGEGIVLRSGSTNFILTTAQSGVSQEISGAYNTPSPIRVHVWKVRS